MIFEPRKVRLSVRVEVCPGTEMSSTRTHELGTASIAPDGSVELAPRVDIGMSRSYPSWAALEEDLQSALWQPELTA